MEILELYFSGMYVMALLYSFLLTIDITREYIYQWCESIKLLNVIPAEIHDITLSGIIGIILAITSWIGLLITAIMITDFISFVKNNSEKAPNNQIVSNIKNIVSERNHDNHECLEFISNELKKNPDLRFNQLMYILNGTDDWFNEEPSKTLSRWKKLMKA